MRHPSLLAILLAPLQAAAEAPFPIADYVVEHHEKVGGRPMADFVNDWWQWAHSMPRADSPITDTTGARCGVNQDGAVWYLAGGFGSSRISRACTVPGGRHIFFPVINMLATTPPDTRSTCTRAMASATANNSRYVYIRVSLDGSEVEDAERFRLASSSCFDLYARVPAAANPPRYFPSATDGTWVMLRPLPPGQHRLEFRAFYTNSGGAFGDMVQNIAYDLTILPE